MQHQTWHISNIGPLGSNGCVQKLNKLKNGILWFHHKITGRRNVMHFSFPKNFKSFPKFPYFWNLLKRLIFAVFRSSNMFLLIFFYLFITFHINILIDYFFHITCVFHCTINNISEIIINTTCDDTNFRLVINFIYISITLL